MTQQVWIDSILRSAAISSKCFTQLLTQALPFVVSNEGRGAQGFVIVCDESRAETLESVARWLLQI